MLKRVNNVSPVLSLLLPFLGFVLILFSLNLYQYYKVKNTIATANIAKISNIELSELQTFFKNVSSSLTIAQEWGKNDLLLLDDAIALNKKLFPFVQNRNHFRGMVLADSSGQEYYLYRTDHELVTRTSRVGKNSTSQIFRIWTTPDQKEKEWQEESDYDPRKRPWFVAPGSESRVSWTNAYPFFHSGKPGITASISWIAPESSEKYMVFGVDFLVEDLQGLLNKQQQQREGIVFLVNTEAKYYIGSSEPYPTVPDAVKDVASQNHLIEQAIESWKTTEKLAEETIVFSKDKQKWFAQFRHLGTGTNPIWVGVAASEKSMTATLKNILFKVDATDLLLASAGGILMFVFFWRSGWQQTGQARNQQLRPERLQELINEGEGAHLEFKASVRYNINTDKAGKEIELAWLKALVALMNSGGGTLLLGVADDGTVLGIDHDKFENDDRCLLHVKNLINQHIGAEFSSLLNASIMNHKGFKVVAIECTKAKEPVFLKVGKTEEFYIRSGPSNTKLSPSQIISYVAKNRF